MKWRLSGKNQNNSKNHLVPVSLHPPKPHINCAAIKPRPPRWNAGLKQRYYSLRDRNNHDTGIKYHSQNVGKVRWRSSRASDTEPSALGQLPTGHPSAGYASHIILKRAGKIKSQCPRHCGKWSEPHHRRSRHCDCQRNIASKCLRCMKSSEQFRIHIT